MITPYNSVLRLIHVDTSDDDLFWDVRYQLYNLADQDDILEIIGLNLTWGYVYIKVHQDFINELPTHIPGAEIIKMKVDEVSRDP